MKIKTVFTTVLILFIVASVAHFFYYDILQPRMAGANETNKTDDSFTGITVYYFHNTKRCPTCLKIEKLASEIIHTAFAEQLKDGTLRWKVVNIDEPENKHFEDDYQLIVQSLVLVDNRPQYTGQWKNLEKIWDLVWEEKQFNEYVDSEVTAFLENR